MEKKERAKQVNAYPLRLDPELRAKIEQEAKELDRSFNWLINRKLQEVYGLRAAA